MIEKSIDPGAELKGAFDPDYSPPDESEDGALPDEVQEGPLLEDDAGTSTAADEETGDKESDRGVPAKGGG
jgi:hypothetical protein